MLIGHRTCFIFAYSLRPAARTSARSCSCTFSSQGGERGTSNHPWCVPTLPTRTNLLALQLELLIAAVVWHFGGGTVPSLDNSGWFDVLLLFELFFFLPSRGLVLVSPPVAGIETVMLCHRW